MPVGGAGMSYSLVFRHMEVQAVARGGRMNEGVGAI